MSRDKQNDSGCCEICNSHSDKQIEETKIASEICPLYEEYGSCEKCDSELDIEDEPCYYKCVARLIISKDYRKASKWISVKERLPEESGKYIIYTNRGITYTAVYNATLGKWNGQLNKSATHWMPLPEPPQEVTR